jgi:hypothetical protein
MKLGQGEIEQADSEGNSRQFTQTRFLVIAEKIHPQILIEARDGPFILFRNLYNTVLHDKPDEFWNDLNKSWKLLENLTEAKAFLDSLKQWAQDWNLQADWCIDTTLLAMRRYVGFEHGEFSWFYPAYKVVPDEEGKKTYKDKVDLIFDYPVLEIKNVPHLLPLDLPSPPGRLPAWDPYLDPLKEGYLIRLEWEAKQRLENDPILSVVHKSYRDTYAGLVRKEATEYANRVIASIKRQPGLKRVKTKPKLKTHLEWAVRVWVLGEKYSEVARSSEPKLNGKKPTRKAVKEAVKEILELVEPSWAARLEERFPSGRPEKQ